MVQALRGSLTRGGLQAGGLAPGMGNGKLPSTGPSYDADATTYFAAVEAADGQSLESGVKTAINDFIVGCKADGIWSAIKASCILAGARTIAGALVPLVGTAPTNFNFVSADYNRKTGLVGNGSTKYLDSNRAGDADPQNSCHVAVYKNDTTALSEAKALIGGRDAIGTRNAQLYYSASLWRLSVRTNFAGGLTSSAATSAQGLIACSRNSASQLTGRIAQTLSSATVTSVAPVSGSLFVFATRAGSGLEAGSNIATRLAFYSIGESLDLALLDARLTTLMSSLATAIP